MLNRPEKHNAISPGLIAEMIGALREVSARRDNRVIVIEGAGPAFSAETGSTQFHRPKAAHLADDDFA